MIYKKKKIYRRLIKDSGKYIFVFERLPLPLQPIRFFDCVKCTLNPGCCRSFRFSTDYYGIYYVSLFEVCNHFQDYKYIATTFYPIY